MSYFPKGDNSLEFLFASLDDESLPKRGLLFLINRKNLLLQDEILSLKNWQLLRSKILNYRRKFFPITLSLPKSRRQNIRLQIFKKCEV